MPGRKLDPKTNLLELTEQQAAFIEWLVDPNRQGSHRTIAEEIGVHESTLYLWKKDSSFRSHWDRRLQELNVSPDRVQDVINALHRAAVSGDSKAAQLYLQYIDRFTPKQSLVLEDRKAADMSDDELAEQLEAQIIALRSNSA